MCENVTVGSESVCTCIARKCHCNRKQNVHLSGIYCKERSHKYTLQAKHLSKEVCLVWDDCAIDMLLKNKTTYWNISGSCCWYMWLSTPVLGQMWVWGELTLSRLWLEGIQLKPEANNKLHFIPIRFCFINVYTFHNPKPTFYNNAKTVIIVGLSDKRYVITCSYLFIC